MEAMDEHAMVTQPMRHMSVKQVTAEIPPTFDGRASWFQYEEAIDEWCDVTKLDDAKRGPALKKINLKDKLHCTSTYSIARNSRIQIQVWNISRR